MKLGPKIFPHLWYAYEAEEAARFYTSIFPDSRIDAVWPIRSETPSGPEGSAKVVEFTLFGQRFQALSAGPHHEFNDAISLVVLCENQEEIDRYWNAFLDRARQEAYLSGGELLLLDLARNLFNGGGVEVDLAGLADTLDAQIWPVVLEALAVYRGEAAP